MKHGKRTISLSEGLARKVDPAGVREAYSRWPALAKEGFSVEAQLSRRGFERACVIAMGGSAAAGDILSGWLAGQGGPELFVWKGGPLTRDLEGTLAIACSASGQTTETVDMLKTAVSRGATVVSISAGGRLMRVSRTLGLEHVMMPEVLAPRYVLPFVIFSCLSILERGLNLGSEREAREALGSLTADSARLGLSTRTSENPSKRLALRIMTRTPAIYGTTVTRGVGMRFKNVLNENAKGHAYFDDIPEAFHNEIESWEDPSKETVPIFLRHPLDGARDARRMGRMFEMLQRLGAGPLNVIGAGRSSLAQLVTMVYRLDMASYYLALARGVDPFPTPLMDKLKES